MDQRIPRGHHWPGTAGRGYDLPLACGYQLWFHNSQRMTTFGYEWRRDKNFRCIYILYCYHNGEWELKP